MDSTTTLQSSLIRLKSKSHASLYLCITCWLLYLDLLSVRYIVNIVFPHTTEELTVCQPFALTASNFVTHLSGCMVSSALPDRPSHHVPSSSHAAAGPPFAFWLLTEHVQASQWARGYVGSVMRWYYTDAASLLYVVSLSRVPNILLITAHPVAMLLVP